MPKGRLWLVPFNSCRFANRNGSCGLNEPVSRNSRRVNHCSGRYAAAKLLLDILKQGKKQAIQINRIFRQEGSVRMRAMLQRERDPAVRRAALRHYGHKCLTCAFDPVRTYGPWAKDCLEVHHLNPLSVRYRKRARTTLRDVVVVCPTCHRALHAFPPGPAAWRRLKWLLSAEMAS